MEQAPAMSRGLSFFDFALPKPSSLNTDLGSAPLPDPDGPVAVTNVVFAFVEPELMFYPFIFNTWSLTSLTPGSG